MSDTYTREQIVRKLKRLKKKAQDDYHDSFGKPTDFRSILASRFYAFEDAIAAFQKGKNER